MTTQMNDLGLTSSRRPFGLGVIGGPTVVIDYAGLRLITDPTFDPPGDYGAYSKTEGPACAADALGAIDAVLLSHDLHWDNFDRAGRALALTCPLILTGRGAAARLGDPAVGLEDFATHRLATDSAVVEITAVPAQHGPADGERDADGHINTEVHGFVLRSTGLPTVYISGDNAGIGPVRAIAARIPRIDIAVLHCGAARVPTKQSGRPLTLTAARAAAVAAFLDVGFALPVHHRGWSIYTEHFNDVERHFHEVGMGSRLLTTEPGRWADLDDRPHASR